MPKSSSVISFLMLGFVAACSDSEDCTEEETDPTTMNNFTTGMTGPGSSTSGNSWGTTASSTDSSGSTTDTTTGIQTTGVEDATGATASSTGGSETSSSDAGSESGESDTTTGSTGEDPCGMADVSDVPGCPRTIGEGFCTEGADHVDVGTIIFWEHNPPHSGTHWNQWGLWGEYTVDAPLERGRWVHNLEHGGIVFGYNCPQGCDAEVEQIRQMLSASAITRWVLTPDPELVGARFSAVSWTWVYTADTVDPEALRCFLEQHFNHAPEDVERAPSPQ